MTDRDFVPTKSHWSDKFAPFSRAPTGIKFGKIARGVLSSSGLRGILILNYSTLHYSANLALKQGLINPRALARVRAA